MDGSREETARLVLRASTVDDAEAYMATIDDVVVNAMGWTPKSVRRAHQARRLDRQLRVPPPTLVLVCDRTDGAVLGVLSIGRSDGVVTVGLWFGPSGRGRGLAAEALSAYLDMLAEAGLTFVCLECAVDHTAMRRVAERCGFEEAARYRHRLPDRTVVPSVRYMVDLSGTT
ncbi:MAG TPA: GNAT family protein [Iamia sp.]